MDRAPGNETDLSRKRHLIVNQIAPNGKHVELAQVMAAKIAANAPLVVQA